QKLILVDDTAAMFDQRRENLEGFGCEGDDLSVAPEQSLPTVGRERAEAIAAPGVGSNLGVHSGPRRTRANRRLLYLNFNCLHNFSSVVRDAFLDEGYVSRASAARGGAMTGTTIVRRLAIGLGAWLIAATAHAQLTTGTVTGTVKDSQGGIIPGAAVTLISE